MIQVMKMMKMLMTTMMMMLLKLVKRARRRGKRQSWHKGHINPTPVGVENYQLYLPLKEFNKTKILLDVKLKEEFT